LIYVVFLVYALILSFTATLGYAHSQTRGMNMGAALGTILSIILWYKWGRTYV
jgi:hypothetical protein